MSGTCLDIVFDRSKEEFPLERQRVNMVPTDIEIRS